MPGPGPGLPTRAWVGPGLGTTGRAGPGLGITGLGSALACVAHNNLTVASLYCSSTKFFIGLWHLPAKTCLRNTVCHVLFMNDNSCHGKAHLMALHGCITFFFFNWLGLLRTRQHNARKSSSWFQGCMLHESTVRVPRQISLRYPIYSKVTSLNFLKVHSLFIVANFCCIFCHK